MVSLCCRLGGLNGEGKRKEGRRRREEGGGRREGGGHGMFVCLPQWFTCHIGDVNVL